MIFKFFHAQWENPIKKDWVIQLKDDLSDINIDADLSKIKAVKKSTFKKLVKDKCREFAFNTLLESKKSHSKMKDLYYSELKLQTYLEDNEISATQAKFLFKSGTKMTNYWQNFKWGKYGKQCPVCKEVDKIDNQEHVLSAEQ